MPKAATCEMPVTVDVILWMVSHRPGITDGDLSEAMFGKREQPRVHQDCDLPEGRGLIHRDRSVRSMRLYPA